MRQDCQQEIEKLSHLLNERNNQLARCNYDLENSNLRNQNLLEDNTNIFSEFEKMKNHVAILTEQNQKLTNELEFVLQEDQIIKSHLAQKDKISRVIHQNNFYLEKSLSTLDETGGFNYNGTHSHLHNSKRGLSGTGLSDLSGLSPGKKY